MTRLFRSRAGTAALALALLAATGRCAAADHRTVTDAFAVTAPAKPWKSTVTLDVAGQRAWSIGETRGSQALLRVGCEGVAGGAAGAALERLLGRQRAGIRAETDGRGDVERGAFEPDSIAGRGGLRWQGFRVPVRAGGLAGSSWRFVALHPDFPRRRLAYTIAYDESAPSGASPPNRERSARALAMSLEPRGRGLGGGIDEAWIDARAAAFAADIDSAQKLCWSDRADAPPSVAHLGFGHGLVPGGDFYLLTSPVPRDSLVDPAALEYGAVFDRNGDGRYDLLVVNRGVQPFGNATRQPTIAVCADDDFDGRIDGLVVEDGDRDGDGRIDARIIVRDRDGDGAPDEARAFVDSAARTAKDGARLAIADGQVKVRRATSPTASTDFIELMRTAGSRLSELARARAGCPHE